MSVSQDHCDMPILPRSDAGEFGMGGDRTRESIEETNRTCDPVPSDCESFLERRTEQNG